MHALTIARTYVRLGLLNFMQYRADFFVSLLNAVIEIGSALLGIAVIFHQTDSLKGWSREELVILVGIQYVVAGLLSIVIRPSLQTFMESIRQGTFDFLLTKPADAQLMSSVQTVAPQASAFIVGGTLLMGIGLIRRGAGVSPVDVIAFLLLLITGVIMVYAFMIALATLTFWFVKLDNVMVIFNTMFGTAGGWPITIFPAWLRVMLTFVIPVAFVVTIPAQALTGRLTWQTALLAVGLSLAFALASRLFWRYAIRHYTGASA